MISSRAQKIAAAVLKMTIMYFFLAKNEINPGHSATVKICLSLVAHALLGFSGSLVARALVIYTVLF